MKHSYKVAQLEGVYLDAAVAKGEIVVRKDNLSKETGTGVSISIENPRDRNAFLSGDKKGYVIERWVRGKLIERHRGVAYSSDPATVLGIIERDHIFLDPPHDVHKANYKNGKVSGVWESYENWHATVSSRTRTWNKGQDDIVLLTGGRVGRGEGPTAVIAALRAFVESIFGEEVEL